MKLAAILFGILYALVCEGVAFLMIGGGHGWLTPFGWGLLGFIVFPANLYAALKAREEGRPATAALVSASALAIAAALLLYFETIDEGLQYVHRVDGMAQVWIALWAAGHIPLIYAIWRRVIEPA